MTTELFVPTWSPPTPSRRVQVQYRDDLGIDILRRLFAAHVACHVGEGPNRQNSDSEGLGASPSPPFASEQTVRIPSISDLPPDLVPKAPAVPLRT